jgi:hypothetical protein
MSAPAYATRGDGDTEHLIDALLQNRPNVVMLQLVGDNG